ncbi:MAG: lysylphosphatidylglycerol synthase domain-containing protein [Planctomycetota bacterium]|nr:lysylphosphatidylglycerol synthase domain-containing protein [Planctomycetota bacterium]
MALVVYGIWHTLADAKEQFATHQVNWTSLSVGWLMVAGVAYLAGMLPCWWFWHRVLHAMGARPRYRETMPAFYIGHLGKYFPGKALVVVIRTALIRGPRVDTLVATISVFVETLTMMAVGALVAASLLLTTAADSWLFWLALALFCLAGIPTLPPVFRKVVRIISDRRGYKQVTQVVNALRLPLLASGWLTIAGGWFLMGLSLWAVLQSMATATEMPHEVPLEPVQVLVLLTATVGLALVAGFLSLLPGGIGVRELVVTTLLVPVYGELAAILSAVLLRITWLLAELIASGFLYASTRLQAGNQN